MDEPTVTFLLADDDAEDRMLTDLVLRRAHPALELRSVRDGVELLDYLRSTGGSHEGAEPFPSLILLDLNMPRVGGFEVLQEIKGDPTLRHVPVVVLTSSSAPADVERSYALGASAFVTKPMTLEAWTALLSRLGGFYLNVASLPPPASGGGPGVIVGAGA